MDDHRASARIDRSIDSLAKLRLDEEDLDSILAHVGRLGVDALEGWNAAAASMLEKDRIATYGATDERVNAVDQQQYESMRGPCVDSLNGESHYFDGNDVPGRWRQFAEVAAQHGISSVVSFPLILGNEVIGALNFYSSEKGALRDGQREEGFVFASEAAVTLANARAFASAGTQLDQLKEAIETRTMIGQATGLLMAEEGLTSEEAFQKLVKVSQNANIKLRDIAHRYLKTWEEKTAGKVDA